MMEKHPKKTFEIYRPGIHVEDHRPYRISRYVVITLALAFVGSLGLALTYALSTDTQRQISLTRREIQAQKETNTALRAENERRFTLDEVARAAGERLDMNKPDPAQVFYIQVPKQSYVVLHDGASPEEDDTNYFWQGIVSFFTQFKDK